MAGASIPVRRVAPLRGKGGAPAILLLLLACRDVRELVPTPARPPATPVVVEVRQPAVKPETCNGLDDDRDGLVDEDLGLRAEYFGKLPIQGECRAKVSGCISGRWAVLQPMQLPTAEARDCRDNNCNGEVDEGFDPRRLDAAVLLDKSGSMAEHGPRIMQAFEVLEPEMDHVRLARADTPPSGGGYPGPAFIHDFVDAASFVEGLRADPGWDGNFIEPTLDALADAVDETIPFSWAEGVDRLVLLFADEPAHSLQNPPMTEDQVGAVVQASGVPVYIFTSFVPLAPGYPTPASSYDGIPGSAGGLWDIAGDVRSKLEQLLVGNRCR